MVLHPPISTCHVNILQRIGSIKQSILINPPNHKTYPLSLSLSLSLQNYTSMDDLKIYIYIYIYKNYIVKV